MCAEITAQHYPTRPRSITNAVRRGKRPEGTRKAENQRESRRPVPAQTPPPPRLFWLFWGAKKGTFLVRRQKKSPEGKGRGERTVRGKLKHKPAACFPKSFASRPLRNKGRPATRSVEPAGVIEPKAKARSKNRRTFLASTPKNVTLNNIFPHVAQIGQTGIGDLGAPRYNRARKSSGARRRENSSERQCLRATRDGIDSRRAQRDEIVIAVQNATKNAAIPVMAASPPPHRNTATPANGSGEIPRPCAPQRGASSWVRNAAFPI